MPTLRSHPFFCWTRSNTFAFQPKCILLILWRRESSFILNCRCFSPSLLASGTLSVFAQEQIVVHCSKLLKSRRLYLNYCHSLHWRKAMNIGNFGFSSRDTLIKGS